MQEFLDGFHIFIWSAAAMTWAIVFGYIAWCRIKVPHPKDLVEPPPFCHVEPYMHNWFCWYDGLEGKIGAIADHCFIFGAYGTYKTYKRDAKEFQDELQMLRVIDKLKG